MPPSKKPKPYTIGEPFDIGVLNTAKPSRATSLLVQVASQKPLRQWLQQPISCLLAVSSPGGGLSGSRKRMS